MLYAEFQCASHFSFLRSASGCDELFTQAAACGLEALAVTDTQERPDRLALVVGTGEGDRWQTGTKSRHSEPPL